MLRDVHVGARTSHAASRITRVADWQSCLGGFGPLTDVDLVVSGLDASTALQLEKAVAYAGNAEVELLELESLPDEPM